jgi:hypothetical protein
MSRAARKDTAPAAPNGRDAAGRFTKGNPGGPGNPFARRTAAMRKALCDAVSEEDLRQIAEALKRKAKEGDVAAARLVLSYVVGRPEATVDPDTLDEQELRQYLGQPDLAAAMPGVLQTLDPETCCIVVRTARPGLVEAMREQMATAMVAGQVPGTGEQICPPLEPSGQVRQEAPDDDTAPSPYGDNGGATREADRARRSADRRRRATRAAVGAGAEKVRQGPAGVPSAPLAGARTDPNGRRVGPAPPARGRRAVAACAGACGNGHSPKAGRGGGKPFKRR